MTTFPADDPDKVPFAGILPAAPKPFILGNGEGEKSLVFDQLFSILLSADETDDQYGAFTMVGAQGRPHPGSHALQDARDLLRRRRRDQRSGWTTRPTTTARPR